MEQQSENKNTIVSVTMPAETRERIAQLASIREWSLAKAGSYLIKLGLEKLDEQQPAHASAPGPGREAARA
jgi:hypothetical protein